MDVKEHLHQITTQFELCQKLTGLYDSPGSCFHYLIHQCKGACIGEETPEIYNARVMEALENYHFPDQNFFLFDAGRTDDELAVIKVENGKYQGYGYVEKGFILQDRDLLHESIVAQKDNKEVRRIIISYLKKPGHKDRVLKF